MREHGVNRHSIGGPVFWVSLIVLLLATSNAYPIGIGTFDSSGRAVYLKDKVEEDPEKYIEKMKTDFRNGNLEAVGLLGGLLLKMRPENSEVRAMYGLFLVSKGELEAAEEELKQVTGSPGANTYALYARSMILHRESKLDEAIKVCEQAIALDESHPYPRNILGQIYFDLGKYREALDSFKKTVELRPGFLPGYDNLGIVSYFLGDHVQAIRYFQKSIDLNPESTRAYKGMALSYETLDDYGKAIEVLHKGLESNPDDAEILKKIGELQIKDELYEDALKTGQGMAERNLIGANEILGQVALVRGDREQAITFFKSAIQRNPNAFKAYYGLALCYETLEKYPQAIEALKKCLKVEPDYVVALQKLAELQLKDDRYDDALKTGQQLEALGLKGAYEVLGSAALHMGNAKEAIAYLEKATPDSPAADYLLGLCYTTVGNYEKAMACMENMLNKNALHFGAYAARGALKVYLGQRIDPEKELKNQWEKSHGTVLNFIKGSIYASKGMWEDALHYWKSAEGVIRGFSMEGLNKEMLAKGMVEEEGKHLNLGILYYLVKLNDHALTEFEKALDSNKDSILANYLASQAALEKGEREKALRYIERATKKAPTFFTALYITGELYRLKGKPEISQQYLQRALAVKENAGICIKLGMVFEDSGKYEMAEKQYEKAIHLSPRQAVGYNQLAYLYARNGVHLEKALSLAMKANELQPGSAGIMDTIGWIHFKKKSYEKALSHALEANAMQPENPTILYHLGAIYSVLGEEQKAKTYLRGALNISENFEGATEAKRLVNQ